MLYAELCRFNSELVIYLSDHGLPLLAAYILTDLIPNLDHYPDAFFYYFSKTLDYPNLDAKIYRKIVQDYLTVVKPDEMKKIFIDQYMPLTTKATSD